MSVPVYCEIHKKPTNPVRAGGGVQLKCDGTRWRTGGEVKGKLANGVGSQYSHTTSERGVSSITNADAHTSAASSRLNWRPRRFKWTRPFRRKTKTGFCACAITFQTQSTYFYRRASKCWALCPCYRRLARLEYAPSCVVATAASATGGPGRARTTAGSPIGHSA